MSETETPKSYPFSEEARRKRVETLRKKTGLPLPTYSLAGLEASSTGGNIENYIGTIQIPMGLAGPLDFQFKEGSEKIYAPIATTEGALVSSITRGALAITLSGGVRSRVISQRMIRAPQFEVGSVDQALSFRDWLNANFEIMKAMVVTKSSHAELLEIDVKILGKTVHPRFIFSTGDAAGQNMTTFCTAFICDWILKNLAGSTEIEISDYLIEGNLSSDKKASALSAIEGRGRSVVAEATIKASVLKRVLKLTTAEMINRFARSKAARIFTGQIGFNINVANVVAGMFLSTGQDVACVHESSLGEFHLEAQGEDLYISLYMPALVVGTVGGGVKFPGPKDSLSLMGCDGLGGANRLAEIICGYCLALEISTISAIGAGSFVEAHDRLGRKALPPWMQASELNAEFFQSHLQSQEGEIIRKAIALKNFENRHGHVTDMAFQVSKKFCGLMAYHLEIENSKSKAIETRDVFLKLKPKDTEIISGAARILEMLSPPVAGIFLSCQKYLPFDQCHLREVEVSEYLHQHYPEMTPGFLGSFQDQNREAFILIQKLIDQSYIKSPVMEMTYWTRSVIEGLLEQISSVHADHWQNSEALLKEIPSLIQPTQSVDRAKSMKLWVPLMELSDVLLTGPLIQKVFAYARQSIEDYVADGDRMGQWPLTLIHNDFNSRNIALKKEHPEAGALIFDWEFAGIGLAQRDVIEFFIFTLPVDVSDDEIHQWLDQYRKVLEVKIGQPLDPGQWDLGCQMALREFVIARLPFYTMISQFNRCDYLEKILHTTLRFIEALQRISV